MQNCRKSSTGSVDYYYLARRSKTSDLCRGTKDQPYLELLGLQFAADMIAASLLQQQHCCVW